MPEEYPGWMLDRQARRPRAGGEGVRLPPPAAGRRFQREGKLLRKVKWGVLGVAKIATSKRSSRRCSGARSSRNRGDRLARSRPRRRTRRRRHPAQLRLVRRIAGRSGNRGHLQPVAQSPARRWTVKALDAGKHVLCEKPIALNAAEAQANCRRARSQRPARHRGFHGAPSSAVASGARAGTRRDASARCARCSRRSHSLPRWSIRTTCATGPRVWRRRALRCGRYPIVTARYVFGAEPSVSLRWWIATRSSSTDRLASALLEFPGGRHLTFTRRRRNRRRTSG